MNLQVEKCGKSLTVGLPIDCIKAPGPKAGDELEAELTAIPEFRLMPTHDFDKAQFLARLQALRSQMPLVEPVGSTLRQQNRY